MGGHRRPDRAHGVTDLATARRMRLAAATLYVVSGAREARRDLGGFLESVLGAGADIVQLREKDADVRDLLRWGAVFRRGARARDALFIVNDRPDVALAVGADGVHLGQDDLPPRWARRVLGDDALIGLSTHSEEHEARTRGDRIGIRALCRGASEQSRASAAVVCHRWHQRGHTPRRGVGGGDPRGRGPRRHRSERLSGSRPRAAARARERRGVMPRAIARRSGGEQTRVAPDAA